MTRIEPIRRRHATWSTRRLTHRTRTARRWLWRVAYGAAVGWWCRPLTVVDLDDALAERLRSGDRLVVVANHASHADTAVLSLLLGPLTAGRLLPAAAEDHFFGSRLVGWLVAIGVGGLPFPRQGDLGLARCRQALADGDHVLLFPEGTRAGGAFQPGIGVLASEGVTVLPVHLAGTGQVLARGAWWPRRGAVTVTFGEPMDLKGVAVPEATRRIEHEVRSLAGASRPERSAA